MSRLQVLLILLFVLLATLLVLWAGMVILNPAAPISTLQSEPTQVASPLHGIIAAGTPVIMVSLPSATPTTFSPPPTVTAAPPTSSATPTDVPTQTFTATLAAQESATPWPGTVAGGFELGGQVAGFTYPDKMKHAGMVWVKRQLRWSPGASPNEAAAVIADAHQKGFKILLSVLGDPHSIQGGANYADYAGYVGGVAALGADAIEVWNEMNIDREWQSGEISGATYMNLLRAAYTAIKQANPGTMVISGAPAPTGGFGGCSPAGCDDNFYVQDMISAGAVNYLDCIGIHYNEGIVPPSQTSGDPRGNPTHYTRYFQTMINTYYNAAGGRKKLCFTELGYLSGEGYSPSLAEVAPNFAWAGNTSVAQQAQWLADATRLALTSPHIRLIIVFNVDFNGWGSDPQGGYAIVRPDGSCPACESLHAVTGGR